MGLVMPVEVAFLFLDPDYSPFERFGPSVLLQRVDALLPLHV